MYSLSQKKIWVAGHRGMVGSALVRRLQSEDCTIVTAAREELDLTRQDQVEAFVRAHKPDALILAAAKVGGILANNALPADFLYENLIIEANIFQAAHRYDVNKILFLGSSCIYPKFAQQPIQEDSLLSGSLEPTNEWYAIAKIAGIKLAEAYRRQHGRDYISAMPTNLYGPGDNFDLQSSHVLPALIRKAHQAKLARSDEVTIWGTGTPRREFLHVDDCADALIFLLKNYSDVQHVNVGSGEDIEIIELMRLVCRVTEFHGAITHDLSKPDGTPRKLMSNATLANMGWKPRISLEEGIRSVYEWYLETENSRR
ncbi:GDP-L-fucose synthase [Rhizobium grahamii]|uniref:GDP-L-fucose synthase n=1 Tax=Rhizobium grahamii TaxID=1120045 RepID=A0A5Q0CE11_9HYPH|nr:MULTISPECIES: GDP-L-fucose synthase [Rhizobium]QFY62029.1 GDP-L-fucose synthase [Rhizobium grahamii]QRM48794.1 GDP-L-fucose synthase [Rhizobium sp. BG6]